MGEIVLVCEEVHRKGSRDGQTDYEITSAALNEWRAQKLRRERWSASPPPPSSYNRKMAARGKRQKAKGNRGPIQSRKNSLKFGLVKQLSFSLA